MNYKGYYIEGDIYGKYIKKKMVFNSENEKLMSEKIFNTNNKVNEYYNDLKNADILMPNLIQIYEKNAGIVIIQEFIKGYKLSDWIKQHITYKKIRGYEFYYKQLLVMQKKVYAYDENMRIDFNLQNFIIKRNLLYLVDITPPLYIDIDLVNNWSNKSEKLSNLLNLYYHLDWQMVAIIGYWLQGVIEMMNNFEEQERRLFLNALLNIFLSESNKYLVDYLNLPEFTPDYFIAKKKYPYHKKICLILEYLKEEISFEELLFEMKLKNVN